VVPPAEYSPNDVTPRVDAAGPSGCGSRDYEVGNDALVEQVATKDGPDTVGADDVTFRVDVTWQSGRSPREVNGGEVKHLGTRARRTVACSRYVERPRPRRRYCEMD